MTPAREVRGPVRFRADGALIPSREIPDEVVETVHRRIATLQRDATVALAIEMGKVIVDAFYQGDLTLWRRHGAKETSLRKLAARFERDESSSGMSASAIYRVVAIYELDSRVCLARRRRLSLTHIRSVLGLPPTEQERLLDEAEARGWSTRQLEDRVAVARQAARDGRGRPRLPAFVKTANLLGKLAVRDDSFSELEQADEMDDADVTDALEHIVQMRRRLGMVEARLKARLGRG